MSYFKYVQRCMTGLLVAAAVLCGRGARADVTLWYNGNLDQRDAIANQTGAPDGLVYDNFIVPSGQRFSRSLAFSRTTRCTGLWVRLRTGRFDRA